jgi:mono/diheme cytochrome c family protein
VAGCRDEPKRVVSRNAAREALSSQTVRHVPAWARSERLPKRALPGARLFALSGCTNCHTYLGAGARNLGAPDLSSVGLHHGRRYFERYVAHPARFGNDVMPPFAALGARKLRQLAIFLSASKGAG